MVADEKPRGDPPKPTGEPSQPSSKPPEPSGKSTNRWPLLVVGGVVLAALALAAGAVLLLTQGDSGDSSSSSLPSAEDLPPNVALVIHVPKSVGEVTQGDFDHALEQTAAASGLKAAPAAGSKKYEEMREPALKGVVEAAWIQGQAAEMGIAVTPAQIAAELAKLKKQSFKTEAEYKSFLETSHYTDEDVDERVKLQLLSTRIQQKVAAEAAKKGGGSKALAKFVSDFEHRWRSRTVCAPDFVIEQCSNGELKAPTQSEGESGGSIPGAVPPG